MLMQHVLMASVLAASESVTLIRWGEGGGGPRAHETLYSFSFVHLSGTFKR